MVSGVKPVTKQEEEQEDNSEDMDAKGDSSEDEEGAHGAWPAYQDAETEEDSSSEDDDESEPETKEKGDDEETEPWDWGRCTVHLTRDDLPKMRKTTPMNTPGNFLKFMFRFKQAMKFPGTKWFVPAWGAVARSYR